MFRVSNAQVALLAAITVLAAVGTVASSRVDQGSPADPARLIGSWSIDVTPDPGGPLPPGLNFAAFTADGILVNSNHTGHASIGSWTKVGPKTYEVTFTGFELVEGQQLRFIARGRLELSADSANFDGPFQSDIYIAGAYVGAATGTVHGERITVQPLP